MFRLFVAVFTIGCIGSGGFAQENGVHILERDNCKEVLELVSQWLPKDPIIIEAGCYNGEDSIRIGSFWPKGRIYSFEPVPKLFNEAKIKAEKYKNIKFYQKALSDQNGRAKFHVSWSGDWLCGSSSLLPAKKHLDFFPTCLFPEILDVETITLDTWALENKVERIDFLWLDMQGYELNTLKASQLAKRASAIYLEVEFLEAYEGQYLYNDVVDWMKLNGFHFVARDFREDRIEQDISAESRFWGNILFVKEDLFEASLDRDAIR